MGKLAQKSEQWTRDFSGGGREWGVGELGVVTLPTVEAEILATFAPELVSPQAAVMPKVKAIAPISALEMLTIRELKRMASRVGVRNYSSMRKGQLIEEILAKESVAA